MERSYTLSWIHLRCVGEEVAPLLCVCVCVRCDGVVGEWGAGGGAAWTERARETKGRAGRGLQRFPGRALSRGSFSSWDSVNRQWLNGDEKGAGVGRTAQGEAAPHENCAPVKALFWLVLRAHKQTELFIGSVTVTPLAVKHICFFLSLLVIKRVTYFACIDCCLYMCIIPTPARVKNNKDFTGEQLCFEYTHTCSDIVNMYRERASERAMHLHTLVWWKSF